MTGATNTLPTISEVIDRRQVILDAAQALIVDEGLEGFRIREVAQRASMHHATLLHYFPNREALISGVVERIVDQFGAITVPDGSQAALPPREALHAHFQHVLALMQTHPNNFIVLHELFLRARRDPAIQKLFDSVDSQWCAALHDLLHAGVEQGAFRADLDPYITATLIMTVFRGLGRHIGWNDPEAQHVVHQIERWIIVPH